MKTKEQIEQKIEELERRKAYYMEEIEECDKQFVKGVHSMVQAESLNKSIETYRFNFYTLDYMIKELKWVLRG